MGANSFAFGSGNEASGGGSVTIGLNNKNSSGNGAIFGGESNTLSYFSNSVNTNSVIVGGKNNTNAGYITSIYGGSNNRILSVNSDDSSIIGGSNNTINILGNYYSPGSTIVGGGNNSITPPEGTSSQYSIIAGGNNNAIQGMHSSVFGGRNNTTANYGATILGGRYLKAASVFETVLGSYNAITTGVFTNNVNMWAGTEPLLQLGNGSSEATRNNALTVLKNGNTGINTAAPTEKIDNNGITRLRNLPDNGTTNAINTQSDGTASTTQNQTFTATRTVVADANGVLGTVAGLPVAPVNIYNANGSLTGNRTLTLNGRQLNFTGTQQRTSWGSNGVLWQENLQNSGSSAIVVDGGNSSQLFLQQFYGGNAQIQAAFNSTGLSLQTSGTAVSAPITFSTSSGGGSSVLGTEKMRITGEGNVGISITDPTEKLDNNGITRLRTLPLNGAPNAINTTSTGGASSAQDQTFTATRTVVADANGVLGYVSGLPTTGGGTPPSGSINVGETISQVYSVPAATASVNTFNLGTYVTANSLPPLPVLDGLQMNLQGVSSTYYDPRIYNVATGTQLVSYQTFATQVNENETSLNNNLTSGNFLRVDQNDIVFWNTANAEVITTNLQVQIDANTYRWYEFKWWCMEVSGQKKIFLSATRKA